MKIKQRKNIVLDKKISEMLINDQSQWKGMKEKFHEARVKYENSTKNMLERLNSSGLRILRRSRKLEQSSEKNKLNNATINISSIINDDEYEYDDLGSLDESDEFEQIENIHSFCDEIHWNVLNDINKSTVYILTTYNMLNKSVCSLSDVEPQTKYRHVCEYGL